MNGDHFSTTSPLPPGPEIIFTNWREILNLAPIPHSQRQGFTCAIEGYLEYCRHNGTSVTKESARGFMSDASRRGLAGNPQLWKDGINWFFKTWSEGSAISSVRFHAFGRFRFVRRIGTATADLPLCCDIQLCNFAFALLELPNPTRTAMAFNVNVVSRRNRAGIASF
jgi:hypothetical protein